MVDRPIIFSGPMVRAIVDGRKSQTRRVAYGPWIAAPDMDSETQEHFDVLGHIFDIADGTVRAHAAPTAWARTKVGDRLWVREAWRTVAAMDDFPPRDVSPAQLVSYESDFLTDLNDGCRGKARRSIHMPRWASRLTLVVTGVKVERLQEISREDAIAEGCESPLIGTEAPAPAHGVYLADERTSFAQLWNRLHGPGSWDANPWIVAVSFVTHMRNIDHE